MNFTETIIWLNRKLFKALLVEKNLIFRLIFQILFVYCLIVLFSFFSFILIEPALRNEFSLIDFNWNACIKTFFFGLLFFNCLFRSNVFIHFLGNFTIYEFIYRQSGVIVFSVPNPITVLEHCFDGVCIAFIRFIVNFNSCLEFEACNTTSFQ